MPRSDTNTYQRPQAAELARWRRYVLDASVETSISRDVLLLTRVEKPALLRRLFELGCRYCRPVLSCTKDAGPVAGRRPHQDPWPTISIC